MLHTTILRLRDIKVARGRSRSSHYSDIKGGLFTKPVRIGSRSVGWPANEVELLNAARIAGKSDDEIRALVERLPAARKAVTIQNVTCRPICDSCNGCGANPNTSEECEDCDGSGYEPISD